MHILPISGSQLSPTDADLTAMEGKHLQAARQKLKAPPKVNALAAAGALDTMGYRNRGPENTKAPEAKPTGDNTPNEPRNQKLEFVRALLTVGALYPAFKIVAQFPWMIQAYGELASLVIRTMNFSLQPLLDMAEASSPKRKYQASNARRRPWNAQRAAPVAKDAIYAKVPGPVDSVYRRNVFFYPGWSTYVPLCSTLDDILSVVQPMMKVCGTQISRDPELIGRMAQIGRYMLSEVSPSYRADPNKYRPESS